jgi:voltage-gated potassium channel
MKRAHRRLAAGAAAGVRGVGTNPIERRMSKFLREPPSIRTAASVIVTATAVVVIGGGALIRVIDHHEYSNIWVGMWWALQTVTTVGYGDVTPKEPSGRVVAAFVMLEGIAFLAIITAAITSTFVARAERERALAEGAADAEDDLRLERSLGDVAERLDRVEATLRELADQRAK